MILRVALFITCLTDTFFPEVGRAVVRVLEHYGCQVSFPRDQTCCGQPACNSGFHHHARAQARAWLRAFARCDLIVTPSGSCADMVRHRYPELFAHEPDTLAAVRRLAPRTHEFVSFLRDVLRLDPRALPSLGDGQLTYHYSCHLRGQQTIDQTTDFIRAWAGPAYVPCERIDQCCGFGGVFAINHPPVSDAMGRDKLDCLLATGADTVISNEPGCTLHMAGLAHRLGHSLRFRHIAELLADSLDTA